MTNLEYIRTLDSEQFVAFIYEFFIKHGQMYTYTIVGQNDWLKKEYNPRMMFNVYDVEQTTKFLKGELFNHGRKA